MLYVFEDCELDTGAFELRRGGEVVKVEPQVFDVLLHLIRHRDRVVTKEELLDEVWGDRFVSESALTSRLKAARRAIGDDGQAQRCIRTAHGRGYRFVAPTEEHARSADASAAPSDASADDVPTPTSMSTSRSTPPQAQGGSAAPESAEARAIAADAASPIRYTRSDDLNIAYQITGSGDVDTVLVAGFVSHLMLDWTERRHAHFLHRLRTFSRLVRFDKRGTGMSDRPGGLPDLETRMGDVAAVMEAARSDQAVLFGYSEGGPMSILYAATYPERVRALVIYGSYARRLRAADYPWGFAPDERARYAERLEQEWAWEADMRHMCPHADDELARWWGERCRSATSPGAARALVEMNSLVDVRDALAAVRAPTLVLHRRDDIDSRVAEGRYIAERIPGATFVELEGSDHFVAVDPDQILDPVEEFVRALGPSTPTVTSLATLLAVRVDAGPDPVWVRGVLRDVLEEHRGVPATSSAAVSPDVLVLATFDGPGRAVRSAAALVGRAGGAGIEIGVGLHTAEIERRGDEIAGAGVAVTLAVAERAPAGQVWVTSTVRDLTGGSDLVFEHRETLELGGRAVDVFVVV